jgi:hypothetical protein
MKDEQCYGKVTQDALGGALGYLTAGEITKVLSRFLTDRKNRAVHAYLYELDPTTPVALYWH